jgi:hypothetical protein
MQHAMDRAPEIRQITRFADRVGSDNPDKRVNHASVAWWRRAIIT